jgi:hypothetical protein
MIETFNKAKDWLLIVILGALFKVAFDIKSTVDELKRDKLLVEYRIQALESKMVENQKEDDKREEDIFLLKTFILPDKTEVISKRKKP